MINLSLCKSSEGVASPCPSLAQKSSPSSASGLSTCKKVATIAVLAGVALLSLVAFIGGIVCASMLGGVGAAVVGACIALVTLTTTLLSGLACFRAIKACRKQESGMEGLTSVAPERRFSIGGGETEEPVRVEIRRTNSF